MKQQLILLCFTCFLFACQDKQRLSEQEIEKILKVAEKQSLLMAQSLMNEKDKLPKTIGKNGELETSLSKWWCSGYFPGTLWYLYENIGSNELKNYAEDYSERIEKEKFMTRNHDVGLMIYCSFGNGLRLSENGHYKEVVLQGAESLCTRYRPSLNCIRSWDWNKDVWQYPVIIDNMMNLEILMWATKYSGNPKYAQIAKSHADKTLKNHFRPDYSCYHVVSYDTITGNPEKKMTYQGFSDESSWARGQAWALYGYTMMFRETGDSAYVKHAHKVASFILNHPNLPKDKIPYWDFNDPKIPNAYRDASAAALIASALIELSRFSSPEKADEYLDIATIQLRNLASPEYLAEPGTNCHFILKHSVGNMPQGGEIDVPLTYADYYFIEALTRYKKYVLNS